MENALNISSGFLKLAPSPKIPRFPRKGLEPVKIKKPQTVYYKTKVLCKKFCRYKNENRFH